MQRSSDYEDYIIVSHMCMFCESIAHSESGSVALSHIAVSAILSRTDHVYDCIAATGNILILILT